MNKHYFQLIKKIKCIHLSQFFLCLLFLNVSILEIQAQCSIQLAVNNIACNNNGTPTDPADDTYSFEVLVTGTGGSPNGFTLNYSNAFLGTFLVDGQYGQAINLGPFPAGTFTATNVSPPVTVTDGLDISLSVTDKNSSGCSVNLVVPSTGPCTTQSSCSIQLAINNKICNTNGTPNDPADDTYSFNVVVRGTGVSTNGYTLSYSNAFLGTFLVDGQYGQVLNLGPFPAGTFTATNVSPPVTVTNGLDISLTATDKNNPSCSVNLDIPSTGPCSTQLTCPDGSPQRAPGTDCDDSNPTTENDIIQNDGCTCAGTPISICPDCDFASVGNLVFNDLNNNGLKEGNEPGISGVQVTLLNANGNTLQTFTTDVNGNYGFGDLSPNSYQIMFGTPTGFNPSPRTGFGDNNVDNNSDANPNNGNRTDIFTLSARENNQTIDAGFTSTQTTICDVQLSTNNRVCNDNGTPNDPTDDTYSFDVLATGTGVSPNGFTLNFSNPFIGTFSADGQYGQAINLGPFPAGTFTATNVSPPVTFTNGLDINLSVLDKANPNCGAGAAVLSTGPCSTGGGSPNACKSLSVNGGIGEFTIANIPAGAKLEYLGVSTGYGVVVICEGNCGGTKTISNLSAGEYTIKVQTFNPYCYTEYKVNVTDIPTCVCNTIYQPVCGSDGVTYENACLAECAGVSYTAGACSTGGGSPNACENLSISGGNRQISISNIPAGTKLEYLGISTGYGVVVICDGDCGDSQVIENLSAGEYTVKAQTFNPYCYKEYKVNVTAPPTCVCNTIYQPVCGSDGVTYENACLADCAGVSYTAGACSTGGGSPNACENLSISGGNRQFTISNIPAGTKLEYLGISTGYGVVVICDGDCGDSQVFANLSAGEYTVKAQTFNPYCYTEYKVNVTAPPTCVCNTIYQPVCGSDGVTYENACLANCAGVSYTAGACSTGGGSPNACENLAISAESGKFTIRNIPSGTKLEYLGRATGWGVVVICDSNCGSTQTIANLSAGEYTIKAQTFNPYCYAEYKINVTGSGAGSRTSLAFSAYESDRQVALQWATNATFKTDYYVIEKSMDGTNFEELSKVVNVLANDNMETFQEMDEQPQLGDNFYRVKQVYRDGTFDYTTTERIRFTIDLAALAVYPNPVTDRLFINLKPYVGKQATLLLTNQYGQNIQTMNVEKITTEPAQMEVNQLPNGLYMLTIQPSNGLRAVTKKILISRLY